VHRHPRTSNCSSYATRSPYSAEPTRGLAWTGPTEPCLPHSSDASLRNCAGIGWSPGHDPALAPPPGHQEVDLPEPLRSPTGQRHDRRPDRAAGPREPDLGLPAHPRRTTQTRASHRRLHDPQDPQAEADTAGAAASDRYDMATVPAGAGIEHAGRGLLPCRLRGHSETDLRVVRPGSPQPLRAHPRNDQPPDRILDRPAGPQPALLHWPRVGSGRLG
jgi:hypothetical protein